MPITVESLTDLVQSTYKNRPRNKVTNLLHNIQDFVGYRNIFTERKANVPGGLSNSRNLAVGKPNSGGHIGLYAQRTYETADGLKEVTVPWRHTYNAFMFDVVEQKVNNAGADQLINEIEFRRMQCQARLIEIIETAIWSKPATSADETTPWGIPMFIVKEDNLTPGFIGGNPAGFSGGYAGVDSDVYDKWQNWAGAYTNISIDDLVRKAITAIDKTRFRAPMNYAVGDYSTGEGCEIYTNYEVYERLGELARAQNENIGSDLGYGQGKAMIKGCAINWTPELDSDTTNPFYGINFGTVKPAVLSGRWMVEIPDKLSGRPTVAAFNIDCSWNLICEDRRRSFVLQHHAA